MRVLYIHEVLGSLAGAEAHVFSTARELRKRGHTVGIAARNRAGKGEETWQALFSGGIFFPRTREDWRATLARFQPDLLYMHKWEELESIELLLDSGPPMVRMVHDHDIYCLRSYKYNPLSRRICPRPAGPYCVFPCLAPIKINRGRGLPLQWRSYAKKRREIELNHRFDRHLVVSEFMRHELVINGFDAEKIEKFPPVPRPMQPLESNFGPRNLVLYIGQIVRGKGVDILLKALAKVQPPFEAIILGDGNHRPYCEKLAAKLGLADCVKFVGFVPQEQLRQYYREATAVLISSVWPEPIATVGLEAMRFALPVVAFDAGGITEWLRDGENGILVPWMDVDAFAAAIQRLIGDKELARSMGRKGLERVNRDYDFEQYIVRLEGLFKELIHQRQSKV